MSRVFYTADLHLGHANIIKYCNRPFKDVIEMNEVLICNWNARVKPEDTVIHNGDFCFKTNDGGISWRKKLNGNIVFIRGNHDRGNSLTTYVEKLYLIYRKTEICVTHWPEKYDPKIRINFVGHVHDDWKFKKTSEGSYLVNIGVDCWDFKPITFEEIMKGLKKWQLVKYQECCPKSPGN